MPAKEIFKAESVKENHQTRIHKRLMDFYIEKFGFVIIRKRNKEEEANSISSVEFSLVEQGREDF